MSADNSQNTIGRLANTLLPPVLLVSLLGLTFSPRANWRVPPSAGGVERLQVPHDVRFLGSIDTPLETETGSSLLIAGWAAATTPGQRLAAVELYVNGHLAERITDFFPRTDVVAAFARPDFEMSGWRSFLPTRDLKAGRYDLEMRVVTPDGESVSLLKKQLSILE
jgi:hypothetical protein